MEQIYLEATRQGLEPGLFLAGFLHDRFTNTQELPIEERSDAQVLDWCDRIMTGTDQAGMSQLLEHHREGLLTEPEQAHPNSPSKAIRSVLLPYFIGSYPKSFMAKGVNVVLDRFFPIFIAVALNVALMKPNL